MNSREDVWIFSSSQFHIQPQCEFSFGLLYPLYCKCKALIWCLVYMWHWINGGLLILLVMIKVIAWIFFLTPGFLLSLTSLLTPFSLGYSWMYFLHLPLGSHHFFFLQCFIPPHFHVPHLAFLLLSSHFFFLLCPDLSIFLTLFLPFFLSPLYSHCPFFCCTPNFFSFHLIRILWASVPGT